jgi:TRAP-type mannitol/chloroaromatic compound transport system substrate-binding protein
MPKARKAVLEMDVLKKSGVTRRRFLGGAGVAGVAALPMLARAQQAPVVLRLHGAWSARDIFHEYALDFAKKINDMAGARLRVEVLPAGAVVKAQDLLDAVHKGVIDGCHAVPALWHAREATFSLFGAGPALGMDAHGFLAWLRYGGGMDLFTELVHRQLNLNVTAFFTGPMPTQPLGWFKKPVVSSAGFKGMKVPASGLAADFYREMGASVTPVAENDIAAVLKSGRLDAAEFNNASSGRWQGVSDAAKICMLQSFHRTAESFVVLINRKKFESLPEDLQAIVRHAADAASADMAWKALHRYPDDQAWMRDREGVSFQKTPAEVLRAQMKAWGVVAARMAKQNPYVERVWQSQQAWAKRTVGWARESMTDSAVAYDFWFGAQRRA